jgi:hypothetical protein
VLLISVYEKTLVPTFEPCVSSNTWVIQGRVDTQYSGVGVLQIHLYQGNYDKDYVNFKLSGFMVYIITKINL